MRHAVKIFLLFLFCGFGLVKAQNSDLKFEHITSQQGLPQSTIYGIVKDKYGFMWFGTWAGLCRFDGYSFKTYKYNPGNKKSINSNRIHNIIKDANHDLWVSTFSKDVLCRYNYERDEFDRIPSSKVPPNLLKKLDRALHIQNKSVSWNEYSWSIVNTATTLMRLDKKSGQKKYYKSNIADPWSLSSSKVSEIYLDNHGIFWVGTYSYGINKANLNAKPIDYYYHDPFTSQSLIDNNVSALSEDMSGNLWVGTRDNGITVISKKGFRHFTKETSALAGDQVRTIFCDSRGVVWIGTREGLNTFNPSTATFSKINVTGLEDARLYAITEDSDHNVWIGGTNGLFRFNSASGKLKHISTDKGLSSQLLRAIIQDRYNQLWVGSEGGGISVYKLPKNSDSLVLVKRLYHQNNINSISDNRIYSICEDREGMIWIGTGNGLDIYNPLTNKLMHCPVSTGLADVTIAGIVEGNDGNMWVSYKNGVTRLSRKTFEVRNFTQQDGLQSNEFSDGAILKSRFGDKLFAGGNNGLNAFNPLLIKTERTLPNTVLTELHVLNQKVGINEKINDRIILKRPLYLTSQIELAYNDKSVAIEFAGLHYSNPAGNKYAYRLNGFDKRWIYTDASRRRATYSNLDPGEYTFEVISSNSDGIWNNKPTKLNIIVHPPFWASNLAYFFYTLVLILVFYTYHQYSTKFTKLRSKLLYESLIRQRENELHQSKLQFFTNISHEIKTPLTLILAPLEKLLYLFSDNQLLNSQLVTMKSSCDRLLKLVNQLLDFRKLETGNERLNMAEYDLVDFLKRTTANFRLLAEAKNLNLELAYSPDSFYCFYDEDSIEKVVSNLLSNALKFTPPLGLIRVSFSVANSEKGQTALIQVTNTGSLVAEEDTAKIFEPFQQGSGRQVGGTGLGLAFSKGLVELHGGTIRVNSFTNQQGIPETSFVIELPAHQSAQHIVAEAQRSVQIADTSVKPEEYAPKVVPDIKQAGAMSERILVNDKIPVVLIVEDNPEVRKYLVEHFENSYNILEAENGVQGLQIASQELPDLIMSDVMMPEMDGFEFCKLVKSNAATGHIPVILITARSPEDDKIHGIETGADDYIVKPFSLEFLTARVKSLLISRHKLKEKYRHEISLNAPDDVPVSPDEKLMQKMLRYVEERLADADLNIDEICSEIGVSRANLYRKVKAMTGLSILEVIKEIRLKRAKHLLKDQKFNVNEVSFLVGFSDSNHFRKSFKAEFGVSPTEFKKLINNGTASEE